MHADLPQPEVPFQEQHEVQAPALLFVSLTEQQKATAVQAPVTEPFRVTSEQRPVQPAPHLPHAAR